MLSIFILKSLTPPCLIGRAVGGYLDASLCTHLPEARSSTGAGRCCSLSQRRPAVRIRGKTEKGENPVQKTHLHPCDWK